MTWADSLAILSLIVLLAVFFGLSDSNIGLREFGSPNQTQRAVDQYYIDSTIEETGCFNVVTAILLDYRGYDTLGEATVLFTAVAGLASVLKRRFE